MKDIKIFDVRQSLQITDCFLLATGLNRRHLKAAGEHLTKELREQGVARRGREGAPESGWVLVDLNDVVIHLFLEENRRFYDLELLWGDCPSVEWEQESREKGEAPHGDSAQPRVAAEGS
jgi:ribosome-associated protein